MDNAALYDIYDVWHVPFWQTAIFYGFVGFIICMLFVFMVLYFFRLFNRKKIILSSWDRALLALRDVKASGLVSVSRSKDFYCSLTNILKTYLHDRYGFAVAGKTDGELLGYLRQQNVQKDILRDIETIFSGITLIKFAKESAIKEQINRDLATAFSLIERTIPKK